MPHKEIENPAEAFIMMLCEQDAKTKKDLFQVQRAIAKRYKTDFQNQDKLVAAYRKLISNGKIKHNRSIESLIRLKNTRSLSGIVVVSVLTKPYACPGNCLYCPSQSDVPKSYLANEPAVMRAIANDYDPYRQVVSRLNALSDTGHPTNKVNIRIIGGTWSYYPPDYQEWFISELFRACNGSPPKIGGARGGMSLDQLQTINETAKSRIVEISIETRQDYINANEIKRLRRYGITKVELGVQTIYDDVLKINQRGNSNIDTINASKLLREAGFKISYQMMPNLPGSDLKRDEEMFKQLFKNPDYHPDYIKIYPLALVKSAQVYKMYEAGKYTPYSKDELVDLIKKIKKVVPRYCRIERVIRDIPATEIVEGGAKNSNLRQIVLNEMAAENTYCQCIRCREIRTDIDDTSQAKMFREDYEANGGREIFLSLESPDRKTLYSLLRLRIPCSPPKIGGVRGGMRSVQQHNNITIFPVLNNAALIREIHTYGRQLAVDDTDPTAAQHQGYGKKLMAEAEKIAKEEFGLQKIVAISGVGVRVYFKKLGYELENTYMVKRLQSLN